MESAMKVCDGDAGAIPVSLVGKWGLMGGTTTRLEINPDGSGSIVGSVWGREPVEWSVKGNRLSVKAERGSGSANYAVGDGNELVLSKVQGLFILVAGAYTPLDMGNQVKVIEGFAW